MSATASITRPQQLLAMYTALIDRHLDDLVAARVTEMLEIEDFAALMFIHPIHLSNTIKAVAGVSACEVYQRKIVAVAMGLLSNRAFTIRRVALLLTFEPSQFTRWFKRFCGVTPKQYRNSLIKAL